MFFDSTYFARLDAPQSLGATASGAAFATSTGDMLEVSCYGPGVFRLRAGPHTRPDYGLVQGRTKACTTRRDDDGQWSFGAGDTAFEIGGSPIRFRLLYKGIPVLESTTDLRFDGTTSLPALARLRQRGQWMAAFALASGEPVYGLGEKFGPLNKRGQLIHSQVVDARGVNTGLAYKNAPFAWSPGSGHGAWGLFANTPGMVSHGVGHPDWSHRSYGLLVDDEALDLFVFAGDTPASILDLYTQLTGRAPAVPDWSLGLWVSRACYKTPEDAAEVAARLRARKIPCDVLALDARSAWKPDTRFNFRWDPDRYPDPKAALAAIKSHHLRICVWEHPYVSVHDPLFADLAARGYLLTDASGDPYVFQPDAAPSASATDDGSTRAPESGLVDFTHLGAYEWWRDAHADLFADGVSAIRTDGGEHVPDDAVASNGDRGTRLHNVYPLLYQRCVFEATAMFQPRTDETPLVLSRAGWAGSQRYPLQWAGEPQSDWEGLAAAIRGGLSWGMSGAPFHATAVGGFYGSDEPTAELYLRWLQAAVFSSHLCLHGAGEREPWAFGAEAEAVARKWLAFRYRLIPYLKGVIAEASRTGAPVMRAMALAFPANPLLRNSETQFMCGDTLLVAPVVAPGGAVEIALPPGAWYDLNSRQRLAGGRVMRYRARLDQFPVFGREGHALPLGPAVQHTGEIDPSRPLEQLWLFGAPQRPLTGFAQASIEVVGQGEFRVAARRDVKVEVFGDPSGVAVSLRD
jgi:alpha-D-xyloside xylohydrolase